MLCGYVNAVVKQFACSLAPSAWVFIFPLASPASLPLSTHTRVDVNANLNGFLSVCVSAVIVRLPVQGPPHLHPLSAGSRAAITDDGWAVREEMGSCFSPANRLGNYHS